MTSRFHSFKWKYAPWLKQEKHITLILYTIQTFVELLSDSDTDIVYEENFLKL